MRKSISFRGYMAICALVLGICLVPSDIVAQIFDQKDLISQLRSKGIDEIHVILGGGIGLEQVTDDEAFLELLDSRLPDRGSEIPVFIAQEFNRLQSNADGVELVQSSLTSLIENLRGSSHYPRFRSFRISNETPLMRTHRIFGTLGTVGVESLYYPNKNAINFDRILEQQFKNYSTTEEVAFSKDDLNFLIHLFQSGFRKIHLSVFAGDEYTLILLMNFFAHLKLIDPDKFDEISVAFYVGASGAAANYVSTFNSLVDAFPFVEFLIARFQMTEFVPLESTEAEDAVHFSKVLMEYLDELQDSLFSLAHIETKEEMVKYFVSFESSEELSKKVEVSQLSSYFAMNGISFAFKKIFENQNEVHYSLAVEDLLQKGLVAAQLEFENKSGDIQRVSSGYVIADEKNNNPSLYSQFVFVLRHGEFSKMRVLTRVGIIEFDTSEMISFISDKLTIGFPGMVFLSRSEIFKEQINFDLKLELARYVSEDPVLHLFFNTLLIDQSDMGIEWMLSTETNDDIADYLIGRFETDRKGACKNIFNELKDVEIPSVKSLSASLQKYRKWLKQRVKRDQMRIQKYEKSL